jgi:hypothetical protein
VVGFNERDLRIGRNRMAGFRDGFPVHPDLSRENHRAGTLARGDEAPFDEEKIEARLWHSGVLGAGFWVLGARFWVLGSRF